MSTRNVDYEDWNVALAEAFFTPKRAGDLVYLDRDDEAFAEACRRAGVNDDEADVSLARAVASRLKSKSSGRAVFADYDLATKNWVRRRKQALRDDADVPTPPVIALLMLFSLAAERIGGPSAGGNIEQGFYSSLEHMLGISSEDSTRFRTSFRDSSEAYWEALSVWLEDKGGELGIPSAYALMHRYVGMPISQALVRGRERKNLEKLFEEQGFRPGMSVAPMDMYGAIDVWTASDRSSANTAMRKIWAREGNRERIVDISLAELAAWEGHEDPTDAASVRSIPGRLLLTMRDFRAGLKWEMRFGVMAVSGAHPGDAVTITGEDGAELAFDLEQIGTSAAGFDIKRVGLEVGAAIGGDLKVCTDEGRMLRRFPTRVIILPHDPVSAGYVESTRMIAATKSRILVKDEPGLLDKVRRVVDDAAQPGYTIVHAGQGGVPTGWTVLDDVLFLRGPRDELTSGDQDLSGFQPRLSTQMSLSGGLKLPGRLPRWSSQVPLDVAIASESDMKVDLIMETRDPETLQVVPRALVASLQVPAVVSLSDHLEGETDFTLVLREAKKNGKNLQTISVRLRDSGMDTHELQPNFRSLCHDLSDPLWPLRSVPQDEATYVGVDGLGIDAPIITGATVPVPVRPAWNRAPRMGKKNQPLRIQGPAADSCIVTGAHKIQLPMFDGKFKKTRWMYGHCAKCGLSKRFPTYIPKNSSRKDASPSINEATGAARTPLPTVRDADGHWPAMLDALYYLGAGTRRGFSVLARQIEDSAIFERELLHSLEALGVLELERDDNLDVSHWEVASTGFGELTDGSWLLTGHWPHMASDPVVEELQDNGVDVSRISPGRQAMIRVKGIDEQGIIDLDNVENEVVLSRAALALAYVLPPLSSVGAGLSPQEMPFAPSYEYFDVRSASWYIVELATLSGLYRISRSYSARYFFRSSQHLAEGTSVMVPVELGKHLAALALGSPLIAYDPKAAELRVPMGADLLGLYARAATMCSGDLPGREPASRSLVYSHVPADVASVGTAALIGDI